VHRWESIFLNIKFLITGFGLAKECWDQSSLFSCHPMRKWDLGSKKWKSRKIGPNFFAQNGSIWVLKFCADFKHVYFP
jgi:hypothetical protein